MIYGKIERKEPRSVIVIDTPGCSWGKCRFCAVNEAKVSEYESLRQIDEAFSLIPKDETILQIASSASFSDYTEKTQLELFDRIGNSNIKTLIIEQRWGLRKDLWRIRQQYDSIDVSIQAIFGMESTDPDHRNLLNKDFGTLLHLKHAARYYDRVNLLYGFKFETKDLNNTDWKEFSAPRRDLCQFNLEVEECKLYFDKIYINIYENTGKKQILYTTDLSGKEVPFQNMRIVRDDELLETFYNSYVFLDYYMPDTDIEILDSDPRAKTDFGGIDTLKRG